MDSLGIGEQPATPLYELAGEDIALAPMVTIPVAVEGPVMTEERASNFGSMSTETAVAFGSGSARMVLRPDPRRRKAVLVGLTQNIRVGRNQSAAEVAGAVWPMAVPLSITARDELWVSCAVTGQTTDVSVVVERWS